MMRRRRDGARVVATLVGVGLNGVAIWHGMTAIDGHTVALAVLGSGMISPELVVDLLLAWRAR